MQRFIAEVSNPIDKDGFEKSWGSDSGIDPHLTVKFQFTGRRISITIESTNDGRWQSDSFHRTFSSAVRRIDQKCNIRWI